MKIYWKFFLAFLFCVIPTYAQTVAPAPPAPDYFTITGNYAAFAKGSTTTPAVIATAALNVTQRISVGYEHISVSAANARWELGAVAYTLPLNALLGKTISAKLMFDPTNIYVTFSAGAGKVLQPQVNRIAETAGFHLSYPLMDHVSVQLVGVDFLHGGVQSGFITTNTSEAISTGLNISF
jgi:hypothetical protein